jgi:hypothetical protein
MVGEFDVRLVPADENDAGEGMSNDKIVAAATVAWRTGGGNDVGLVRFAG